MVTVTTPVSYLTSQRTTTRDSRTGMIPTFSNVYNIEQVIGNNSRDLNKDPNYRVKIALKQDATNNYTRTEYTGVPFVLRSSNVSIFASPYNFHIESEDIVRRLFGWSGANFGDDSSLRELALQRFKNRLQSNIGQFNAIVPVAELREVRGLVRNTAQLATTLVRELIRAKRSRGASVLKYASAAWLNFSFGVKPLVADTKAACESLASYLERTDRYVSLKATAVKTWKTGSYENGTSCYNSQYYASAEFIHTLRYRYGGGFSFNLKSANNYGVSDHFGLEFGQLPSVAWELVPFSWVVDYFTNVGSYLGDTFVLPPGSTKYLYLNKLYTMEGQLVAQNRSSKPSITTSSFCRPGYLKVLRLERTKIASLPHASLRFKSVDEVGLNAVNRLLNLTAVFAGRSAPRIRF